MSDFRSVWEKYSPIIGIIGLIVDTITLIGFVSSHFNWNMNFSTGTSNASGEVALSSNRWFFALTIALIFIGFFALCDYLPTLESYLVGKYLSVGERHYWYHGGLHSIMYSFAFVMPALILWLKVFYNLPKDLVLFLIVFVSSFLLIFLSSITAFENFREKLNLPIVVIISIVLVFFICLGSMETIPAITTAVIITTIIFSYIRVMLLFPNKHLYSVMRRIKN